METTPSLSAEAPIFRPSFPSRSSTPSITSSLHSTFPAARRHSDFPTSSLPPPPAHLSFKTPQLGSAALWEPQDDELSPGGTASTSVASSSHGGRRDSTWGSPLSFLSEVSTSAPGTPADDRRRPSFSSVSLGAYIHSSHLLVADFFLSSYTGLNSGSRREEGPNSRRDVCSDREGLFFSLPSHLFYIELTLFFPFLPIAFPPTLFFHRPTRRPSSREL